MEKKSTGKMEDLVALYKECTEKLVKEEHKGVKVKSGIKAGEAMRAAATSLN